MDALTKAAIDSLIKKILPNLGQELGQIVTKMPEQGSSALTSHGWYLVDECQELLTLIKANLKPNETPKQVENSTSELSDAEAMRLMQVMADDDQTASDSLSVEQELSDDQALRLMAEMQDDNRGQQAGKQPNPAADMSDSEAEYLLAMMEEKDAVQDSSPVCAVGENNPPLVAVPPPAGDDADLVEIDEWEPNDFQTDPDMINDFISNSDEIMNSLDAAILQLEQDPNNKEIIEEIFRGAHTLKGAGGMFGFKALERVMHRLENLFDLIRKSKLSGTPDTVDAVFQGLDLLRELLQAVKAGRPCGAETVPIVKILEQAARGETISKQPKAAAKSNANQSGTEQAHTLGDDDAEQSKGQTSSGSAKDESDKENASSPKKEQLTIRVDLERLDVLVNLVGELVIDRTRFASIEEELRTNYPQIELGSSISETVQLFGRHMNEIQDIIMKVRMVPIGNAFNKFTRIVRDLSRSLNKKIELVISGGTAELDKTLVEQIGDPLIHLIRNSCDHGIESPEDRRKTSKNPVGKIYLSAHQEGNHIVITIQDDGKGMSPEYIRRKAIEKGLVSADDNLTERDIFNLIFEPGFSTVEKITNISGRGVGMDVVKKQIMKLKGMIEIDSAAGRGTTISIRLPLTLAIVQSLLVRSRQETFAIPLSSVIESIRVSPKEIQRVGDTEIFKLRDKVLPLIHLDEALGLQSKKGSVAELLESFAPISPYQERRDKKNQRVFIVVVGHHDRPTGIIVDQLLNQQEMVIKSMGHLMKNIPCVAGGAVLGQGEVVLVLDIPELEHITKSRSRGSNLSA